MEKRPLYELAESYQALMDMVYDQEVDEQTVRDTMEGLWGEIEDKADGYAKILMGMKADIEALREEGLRLNARRKALETRSQWLKDNLEANMRAIGKTKFKTALFSFNIQKNGGLQPLVIDGLIDDIPGRFLIQQAPIPNNEAIRKLLEEKQVDWAHLEPRGESLRIR
ncbi:MAG: siphovirus Gp157 family protein [Lachnospiraceae bacterium]|nr:siphovirus Gp157 family protein [Lachnospiraceae bacterium]